MFYLTVQTSHVQTGSGNTKTWNFGQKMKGYEVGGNGGLGRSEEGERKVG